MRRSALVAIPLLVLAAPVAARGDGAVVTLSPVARGLAIGAPRGTSFDRALESARLAADATTPSPERLQRWREAARRFFASEGELAQAAEGGELDFARARTLALQARLDGEWAERLARLEREQAPRGIADARFEEALALHHLCLASASWTGRVDGRLYHRARAAYEAVVRADRVGADWPRARLGLAALLAAVGEKREARVLFAKAVVDEESEEMTLPLLVYYAAMGEADRAFALLAEARAREAEWPAIRASLRASNDLDALRDDPRFVRLLGPDE